MLQIHTFVPIAIVALQVLFQMIFSIKCFAALRTDLILATGMCYHVTSQVFISFKRFATNFALKGPVCIMALFMSVQMFFSFQTRSANITNIGSLSVLL